MDCTRATLYPAAILSDLFVQPPTYKAINEANMDSVVKATLDWCNEQRARKNLGEPLTDLPKGRRSSPWSCPCGAATQMSVVTQHASDLDENEMYILDQPLITLPRKVQEFIAAFDQGSYPQYDIDINKE